MIGRGHLGGYAGALALVIATAAAAQDDPFGALYAAPAAKGDKPASAAEAIFGPQPSPAGKGASGTSAARSDAGVLVVEAAVGRSYAGVDEKEPASLSQIAMLPKAVPAMALELKASSAKYLRNRPKIAIAGYSFAVVRGVEVSASASGSGTEIAPRRTTLSARLEGVSDQLAASLAQEAYEDLRAKLEAAGYQLATPQEFAAAPHMQSLGRYDGPVSSGGVTVYAPQGAALIKGHAFETGFGAIAAAGALLNMGQASKELDAVILAPKLMLGTVNAGGSGNHTYAGGASVGARVRFTISPLSRVDFVWGNDRGGAMSGLMTAKGAATDERFGVLIKTADRSDDPAVTNAFANAGMGSIYRQNLSYALTANPDRFAALCRAAFQGFNSALVAEIQRARAS